MERFMTDITLDYLAAARVSGEDAGSFLQAQLSADLARLSDDGATFAAYCHPRGNVIAVIRVLRRSDAYILIVSRRLLDTLIAELRKYVLRAKVVIESLDHAVAARQSGQAMNYILVPEGAGTSPAATQEMADWHAAELRRGVVWLGPETSNRFLPQMLGLDRLDAVSFRKGCYPGQEVIARVRYLGKVKQLPLVVSTGVPLKAGPGEEIELLGDDGPVGSAVAIDSAPEADGSVVFLVARNPRERAVTALRIGDLNVAVRETV